MKKKIYQKPSADILDIITDTAVALGLSDATGQGGGLIIGSGDDDDDDDEIIVSSNTGKVWDPMSEW